MKKSLLTVTAMLVAGAGSQMQSSTPKVVASEKPNVLIVIIDDLNDWTGPFGGHPQAKTPHFDRLASRNAMVMLNAQAPSTTCGPSRSSFLTGLWPASTGVYGNQQNLRYSAVASQVPTMPQYFSQHGYHSLSTGKIFHGHDMYDGRDQGQWAFDQWENSGGNFRVDNAKIPLNGLPGEGNRDTRLDWGPTLTSKEETSDWKSAAWAAGKIRAGFSKPFFLMVGIYRPHLSWYVPQEYFDRYNLEDVTIPVIREDDLDDILKPNGTKAFTPTADYNIIKRHDAFKEATRAYLACVSYADDCLGLILDALDASPYKDNTIVVVAGDHGWFLGEKLRFRKNYLWEESCRVPLIMKTPAMTSPAKTKAIVNLSDLYPTLAELCGLPVPSHCEGRSFVPLLEDPELDWYPSLTTTAYKSHSIRSRQYRFNSWADGTEELYDHYVDSMEWYNLIRNPEYAEVAREMRTYLPTHDEPQSIRNDDVTRVNSIRTKSSFSVYPSGFSDYVYVNTNDLQSSIDIYNVAGMNVKFMSIRNHSEAGSFKIIKN